MINLNEGFSQQPIGSIFQPGQVIIHRKYQYRGVIVAFDSACQAPDTWYLSNQMQPDREQPWYHVLVDGTHETTYAAQSNLQPDLSGDPVVHPMLNLFFSGIDEEANRYLRNDLPWNPGQPPEAPQPLPPDEPPPSAPPKI